MREPISFGETIKGLREEKELTLKEVSRELGIDTSMLGKIEKGQRSANRNIVKILAVLFDVDEKNLLLNFLSDKVVYQVAEEEDAKEILKVAEAKVKYIQSKK